jgi:ribosome silencing factor RsfS/YbeB/iojap
MTARKISRPPARAALVKSAVAALEDMKAANIKIMDVRKVTDVADCMILASGNSDRHVRSISDRVVERAKAAGFRPMGVEGQRDGEWVLVDLNDVIVHVMLPRVREFYGLEELWETVPSRPKAKPARGKAAAKSKSKGSARPASKTHASRAKSARPATAASGRKPARKSRSRG